MDSGNDIVIKLPFGDDTYHPLMVIGWFIVGFTTL